ncbi:MAG: hypothetical protein K5637_02005 [Lachnospiraceae bacterium]|nr:hypothetical protein [Lachnospiraceae bacterium]
MTEAIIVAIITAGASIVCQLIIANKGKKERIAEEAKKDQELKDKLKAIEDKLDVHNGYAAKLSAISEAIVALQKDIEWIREGAR